MIKGSKIQRRGDWGGRKGGAEKVKSRYLWTKEAIVPENVADIPEKVANISGLGIDADISNISSFSALVVNKVQMKKVTSNGWGVFAIWPNVDVSCDKSQMDQESKTPHPIRVTCAIIITSRYCISIASEFQ